MEKILAMIASTRLTAILFLVFASAMAAATFIENDYGTQTAMALVYKAWWFEAIMVIFIINFIYNIPKYRLLRKEKIWVLMFHLSFIFIIIGAGITRYISFEGMMPIKEGETAHTILSDKIYLEVQIDDNKDQKSPIYRPMLLSKIGSNDFEINTDFKGTPVKVSYVNYIANATQKIEASQSGEYYLHLVESGSGARVDHFIKNGETIQVNGGIISFNQFIDGAINFTKQDDGSLKISTPLDGDFMRMADKFTGKIAKDSLQEFQLRSLYTLGDLRFVVPEPPTRGIAKEVSGNKNQFPLDMLEVAINVNDKTQNIKLYGGKYNLESPKVVSLGGLNIRLNYGAKQIEVPFSIKLRDFQLDRYPGSMSPKSYASEVTVIDKDKVFDFRIFMNHILNYRGYKFFQASYDITSTYEETRLSVNHDFWGTTITYIGYSFLYFGLISIFFAKRTRFASLKENLAKLKSNKSAVIVALFMGLNGYSQTEMPSLATLDSVIKSSTVDAIQAEKFGRLVVQDAGGRMLPVNTFASELMRKVSKHENYEDLNPNQVIVSMVTNPGAWYYVPFIYIKADNTKLRDILNISRDQKFARFVDFFDQNNQYKILSYVEEAAKQKVKSKFEQSVIDVDQRVNLLYNVINGSIFKFFPLPNDENNKWFSFTDVATAGFKGQDSLFIASAIPFYAQELSKAKSNNQYSNVDLLLKSITKYQQKYGSKVMPSERKIDLELFYNKYDIFKGLFWKYLLAGTVMFIFVIFQIFKDGKFVRIFIKISTISVLLLFLYHTLGLIVRWYISGHAPWSNAYESMIYVAWATMLFGLIFGRKSALTIAATAFVTSMILMIAHWNWMDPSIGNLVPVLDSYWLMIHVAIIVASYGPFTLGLILGFISLLLYATVTKNNKNKIDNIIKELTIINEMSLTVGLVMITIGNFLGGMWANESWGRYWGWDPKEVWALISIMIYAFVLHARLVPGLRGRLAFNILSVFAFTSILMTYLGVNHLLSGLHSYAAGESAPIPMSIYYSLSAGIVVSLLASYKYNKYFKNQE